jgi:N-methylhydantoinase A
MSGLRFAIDTGGTFTDLIVENASGDLVFHKSPTTPDDPVRGVINVLRVAAEAQGKALDEFLSDGISLLHGTTRALNAVLSHKTARTAFLTTQGHPDVLMFREGGRENVFDFSRDFPAPYVPRALTWEVPERIGAAGEVVTQLNEARVAEIADEIAGCGRRSMPRTRNGSARFWPSACLAFRSHCRTVWRRCCANIGAPRPRRWMPRLSP